MYKMPVISGKELIKILSKLGFTVFRTKGSHARLKHQDGRATTVPIHRRADLLKGYCGK